MSKEDQFENVLIRLAVSSLFSSVSLQVSREMYGKSYFSLGQGEKLAVDQAAFGLVSANFQAMTEEGLRKLFGSSQTNAAVGFFQPSPISPKET
jgi:hypothetical protein